MTLRPRSFLPRALVALSMVLTMGACGSSAKASDPTTTSTLEVAGPNPSISAQMVCHEAKGEIAAVVGIDISRPLVPKWVRETHLYSCVYAYGGGKQMTLSVKEMSSPAETTAYFDGLGTTLHRGSKIDLGEGAFGTANGSIVVRKDYRVLLVDVSRLPAQFGVPPQARSAFANSVAALIMVCWKGE